MTASTSLMALLVIAGVHAGFQGTVSTVVYPALARLDAGEWLAKQESHRYAVVPMVGICYLGGLIATGWCLATVPTLGVWVAAAGFAISMGTTALVAAPTHAKLMAGHDSGLVRRLLWSDWLRTVGAVIALVGAAWAVANIDA